jgi:hypothetical protein
MNDNDKTKPPSAKPEVPGEQSVTVNVLSSAALDYLDDLFDQEALDEYTQPDLNIEPRPVTQP